MIIEVYYHKFISRDYQMEENMNRQGHRIHFVYNDANNPNLS